MRSPFRFVVGYLFFCFAHPPPPPPLVPSSAAPSPLSVTHRVAQNAHMKKIIVQLPSRSIDTAARRADMLSRSLLPRSDLQHAMMSCRCVFCSANSLVCFFPPPREKRPSWSRHAHPSQRIGWAASRRCCTHHSSAACLHVSVPRSFLAAPFCSLCCCTGDRQQSQRSRRPLCSTSRGDSVGWLTHHGR